MAIRKGYNEFGCRLDNSMLVGADLMLFSYFRSAAKPLFSGSNPDAASNKLQ
jgi:hypothetical protein